MNNKHLLVFVVLVAVSLLSWPAMAQLTDQADLQTANQTKSLSASGVANPFSLLDFSRIRWSHSYSVTYFSGGGFSGTAGLFQTQALYEFSPKLTLGLNLGIGHTGNLFSSGEREATFLPGFTLDYHPSEKFRMTFMFQTYYGYFGPAAAVGGLWNNPYGP